MEKISSSIWNKYEMPKKMMCKAERKVYGSETQKKVLD